MRSRREHAALVHVAAAVLIPGEEKREQSIEEMIARLVGQVVPDAELDAIGSRRHPAREIVEQDRYRRLHDARRDPLLNELLQPHLHHPDRRGPGGQFDSRPLLTGNGCHRAPLEAEDAGVPEPLGDEQPPQQAAAGAARIGHERAVILQMPAGDAKRAEDAGVAEPEHAILLPGAPQECVLNLRVGDAVFVLTLCPSERHRPVADGMVPVPEHGEQRQPPPLVVNHPVAPIVKETMRRHRGSRRWQLHPLEHVVQSAILLTEIEAEKPLPKNPAESIEPLGRNEGLAERTLSRRARAVAADVE